MPEIKRIGLIKILVEGICRLEKKPPPKPILHDSKKEIKGPEEKKPVIKYLSLVDAARAHPRAHPYYHAHPGSFAAAYKQLNLKDAEDFFSKSHLGLDLIHRSLSNEPYFRQKFPLEDPKTIILCYKTGEIDSRMGSIFSPLESPAKAIFGVIIAYGDAPFQAIDSLSGGNLEYFFNSIKLILLFYARQLERIEQEADRQRADQAFSDRKRAEKAEEEKKEQKKKAEVILAKKIIAQIFEKIHFPYIPKPFPVNIPLGLFIALGKALKEAASAEENMSWINAADESHTRGKAA